ncbi:MAG: energy-coupling factor transporter ATPase [Lachnospiraceae bacterium]|nr:energy-coupling factor transporter ATPase [Lachnospiraceae bacterium]
MSIALEHASYIYDKGSAMAHEALRDVTLEIADGTFAGLIGHTGSGKSTLVQLLNGLLVPTSGRVLYDGRDIADAAVRKRELRAKVGLVFQYPEHQLFEADVLSDVMFGPRNLGLDKEEARRRAGAALELVGIDETVYEQSPFDLSGGQKRRVAIAGVIAMEPRVLILDEPTAGLDPQGREEILSLIRSLHQASGMTVILVSHSMEDVARFVERIIVMNHGSVFADGTPAEVFSRATELKEIGLAPPAVTEICRMLKEQGWDVRTDVTTVEEALETILSGLAHRSPA